MGRHLAKYCRIKYPSQVLLIINLRPYDIFYPTNFVNCSKIHSKRSRFVSDCIYCKNNYLRSWVIQGNPGSVLTKKPWNLETRTPYVWHFIIHSQIIPTTYLVSFDSAEQLKMVPNFCFPITYKAPNVGYYTQVNRRYRIYLEFHDFVRDNILSNNFEELKAWKNKQKWKC